MPTATEEYLAEVRAPQMARIAELEDRVRRMRAEAQLCRQDVKRDRERALDRIVEIAMAD
jgi:molecular chaperone GrpE (heat shock protein)